MLRKKLYSDPSIINRKSGNADTDCVPTDLSLRNFSDPIERSKYFPALIQSSDSMSLADKVLKIQTSLNAILRTKNFIKPPIQYVYNPLEYAFKPSEQYVRKFCNNRKKIVFIGMNPGPYGMCQTGVPFGTVDKVRDWLQIQGEVFVPPIQCPQRPITGFNCSRTEISGSRFWGFFSELCGTPEVFFNNCFVYNYCPLAFMKPDGNNITPPDIKDIQLRKELEGPCNTAFIEMMNLLQPEVLIAVGVYVEKLIADILKSGSLHNNIRLLRLAHPSPRAVNNNNWPEKANNFLIQNNLIQYFQQF